MTSNEMVLSFIVSYLAGSMPVWRDLLDQTPNLKKRIDGCYRRAFNKWSVNEDIRQHFRGVLGINRLSEYIVSKGDPAIYDSDVDRLLSLWVDELRNDDICYSFIIEHKIDWLNLKIDRFQEAIEGNNSDIVRLQQSVNTQFDQIKRMLDVIELGIGIQDLSYLKWPDQRLDDSYRHGSNRGSSLRTNLRGEVISGTSKEERVKSRLNYRDILEQDNIERITSCATQELLATDSAMGDGTPDKNWIYSFFKLAGQITQEEMQIIWGKILAGEIMSPNSYSIRTLEILSTMTTLDAEVFSRLACFAISDGGVYPFSYIYHKKHIDDINKNVLGLLYSDIMMMEDIGLISANKSFVSYRYQDQDHVVLTVGKEKIALEIREKALEQKFPAKIFTRAGTELLSLIDKTAPCAYVDILVSYIGRSGNRAVRL